MINVKKYSLFILELIVMKILYEFIGDVLFDINYQSLYYYIAGLFLLNFTIIFIFKGNETYEINIILACLINLILFVNTMLSKNIILILFSGISFLTISAIWANYKLKNKK